MKCLCSERPAFVSRAMRQSCLGNRRGEDAIVANGTATIMAAMAKAKVPRMALVSSIGVGDSRVQLLRLGFGGWIFSLIFATVLKKTKMDLNAAEAIAIGAPAGVLFGDATPHARPAGVSVVVVRPAGLSDAPGDGKYDVARSDGVVGASVAREDVAVSGTVCHIALCHALPALNEARCPLDSRHRSASCSRSRRMRSTIMAPSVSAGMRRERGIRLNDSSAAEC